jgi:uncharacterized protein YyaL (SSP411 family)
MNQLRHETSPYLLQHANNPVHWYAWKPEAFEKARAEDKPILVSIGYATCHWCHVMERESFEDVEVAGYMNENFVCIKVDREERPDVDQIYMEACQIMSGGGGWPLNCFLTPDGRPFFAGTYYPPVPSYNRPSWLQVLMNISSAYERQRDTVESQANRLTDMIRNAGGTLTAIRQQAEVPGLPFHAVLLQNIFHGLSRQFDHQNGGFGGAPKFPGTMALQFLLQYHYYFRETEALEHVTRSLDKMAMGGIYDQLGGGFARYATDAAWLVPHFEKMLYDNALLVGLLADAYQLTGKPLYRQTMEETLEWVRREMTSSEGGFYSALDADSEGVEGKCYVWDKAEVDAILGADAAVFCAYYGVSEEGNWEHHNILWREKDLASFAREHDLDVQELDTRLSICRQRLFEVRSRRVPPGLDDKILLDWNALMCTAYARAYAATGEASYRESACRALDFLLERLLQPDGISLYHTYREGKAQYNAFLDDYAFLIEALLEVAQVTYDYRYLQQARQYIEYVLEQFLDREEALFYFTSSRQQDILLRRKDLYDSATPSGNSTMVRNLQRAGILLGREDWRELAGRCLLKLRDAVERYPSSFGRWATAMVGEVMGTAEIAVTGAQAFELADQIQREFLPHKVLMATAAPDESFPLLAAKAAGETLIYVCRNYACLQPVRTLEEFRKLVNRPS